MLIKWKIYCCFFHRKELMLCITRPYIGTIQPPFIWLLITFSSTINVHPLVKSHIWIALIQIQFVIRLTSQPSAEDAKSYSLYNSKKCFHQLYYSSFGYIITDNWFPVCKTGWTYVGSWKCSWKVSFIYVCFLLSNFMILCGV